MSDNVIDQNMSARNEQHLFIFEGGSAEPLYVKKLEQNFMGGRISVKTGHYSVHHGSPHSPWQNGELQVCNIGGR